MGKLLKVEFPTGSGKWMTLGEVATQLSLQVDFIYLRKDPMEPGRFILLKALSIKIPIGKTYCYSTNISMGIMVWDADPATKDGQLW